MKNVNYFITCLLFIILLVVCFFSITIAKSHQSQNAHIDCKNCFDCCYKGCRLISPQKPLMLEFKVVNTGTDTWSSRDILRLDSPSHEKFSVTFVNDGKPPQGTFVWPGENMTVYAYVRANSETPSGIYTIPFQMYAGGGKYFGETFKVTLHVTREIPMAVETYPIHFSEDIPPLKSPPPPAPLSIFNRILILSITYSGYVDENSVQDSAVTLTKISNNENIPVSVWLNNPCGNTVYFAPKTADHIILDYDEWYEIVVEGLRDRAGNSIPYYYWSFKTQAANDNARHDKSVYPRTMDKGTKGNIEIQLTNTGNTDWRGSVLKSLNNDAELFRHVEIPLDPWKPYLPGFGDNFRFQVTAPNTPGTYHPRYQMYNPKTGKFFGAFAELEIVVK